MSKEKKSKKSKKVKHEITFCSYPKLVFLWPVILLGFLFWPISLWGANTEVLAWIYAFTIVSVFLAVSIDLDRNHTIFVIVLGLAIWAGIWVAQLKGYKFFQLIYEWLANLDPSYSTGLGFIISIILTPIYIIMVSKAKIDDRWRITHNEFEHYSLGKSDDSLARGAKRFTTTYPDFFEFLLGLSGTLEVSDSKGKTKLRIIPNVLFLPFKKKTINSILESKQVTDAAEFDDEEEESGVDSEEEEIS